VKDEYFDFNENAVSLNQKGKPVVIEALQQHLDEQVRYRRRNVKRRHILQQEAHRLAQVLLAEPGEPRPDWLTIKEF
jgi:CRISPR-associated protein Cas1